MLPVLLLAEPVLPVWPEVLELLDPLELWPVLLDPVCASRNGDSDNASVNTRSFFIEEPLSGLVELGTDALMPAKILRVALRHSGLSGPRWAKWRTASKKGEPKFALSSQTLTYFASSLMISVIN